MPKCFARRVTLPLAAIFLLLLVHSSADEPLLAVDDECAAGDGQCALNALQLKAAKPSSAKSEELVLGEHAPADQPLPEEELPEEAVSALVQQNSSEARDAESWHIWHYALPCWSKCHGAGFCDNYCGPNNACCRYLTSSNPPECHNVRFWPVLTFHTCVETGISGETPSGGTSAPSAVFAGTPALLKPSTAPLLEFYMYRVQSDENYSPENQDMANIAGALWYLHNEIVWHPGLARSGTYFTTSKTRIQKFKVKTRATQPLYDAGMNFGVVNTFDLTKCTGPYHCTNFKEYGYAVGCESWGERASAFPHSQWYGKNLYPGATWYSLPGPCSSRGLGQKTRSCLKSEPGGACANSTTPTGAGDCTYSYEKVGEVSINELEGLRDATTFQTMGGTEYDKHTDKGVHMSFWDGKEDVAACQKRMDTLDSLFKAKYPDLPDLPDPGCDFNQYKFYHKL